MAFVNPPDCEARRSTASVSRRSRVRNSSNASKGLVEGELVGGVEEGDRGGPVDVGVEGEDPALKGHRHAGPAYAFDQSTPPPSPPDEPLMPPRRAAPFWMSFLTTGHSRISRAISGFSMRYSATCGANC